MTWPTWFPMSTRAPGRIDQVIFTGGTSLEKLRLIQRFSEDLDLLVVGTYANDRDAKRAIKSMCQAAAQAVGAAEADAISGGVTGASHRRA